MDDKMTRKEMEEYLGTHFRYDTMNSWNAATSYACRVKLQDLEFPDRETAMRAYDFLDMEDAFLDGQDIIREFEDRHNYEWQIGSNGCSSGYLVLYRGGIKPSGEKSYCPECRRRSHYAAGLKCGYCKKGILKAPSKPFMQTFVNGGGVDMDADYSDTDDWDDEYLAGRVAVVKDFDETCKQICQAFVDFVCGHTVEDEEIVVPKTIKVAKPIEGGAYA